MHLFKIQEQGESLNFSELAGPKENVQDKSKTRILQGRHPHPGENTLPPTPPGHRPGVDKPPEDFTSHLDVIFIVQRSGMKVTN